MQPDVRLADGDEAGGFLVFLQQALLEQVVVHADDADLEIAEAAAQFRDAALEGEAEDQQPVAVALVAAGFDGFGDGLFADRAELRADVEIGFLLAGAQWDTSLPRAGRNGRGGRCGRRRRSPL